MFFWVTPTLKVFSLAVLATFAGILNTLKGLAFPHLIMLLPKQAAASARYFEVFKIPAKVAQTANEKALNVGVAQKNNVMPKVSVSA